MLSAARATALRVVMRVAVNTTAASESATSSSMPAATLISMRSCHRISLRIALVMASAIHAERVRRAEIDRVGLDVRQIASLAQVIELQGHRARDTDSRGERETLCAARKRARGIVVEPFPSRQRSKRAHAWPM